MNIKETFLKLTQRTIPYGFEELVLNLLPHNLQKDKFDNFYIKIGESNTIFTSHLDTASMGISDVKHVFDGDYIKTDGESILGADDKAGVTIMLYMINNNIPGLYYFFVGEEVGCIGSGNLAKEWNDKTYTKMVSFDRRGTKSIITHQSGKRTASDEFADSLSREFKKHGLKLEKDNTGVYTDSAEFKHLIPECTNISVGYYDEHRTTEKQDIVYLEKLCHACIKINWDNLVVKRDPKVIEETVYESYFESYYSSINGIGISTKKNKKKYLTYDDYGYESCEVYNRKKNKRYYKSLEKKYLGEALTEEEFEELRKYL